MPCQYQCLQHQQEVCGRGGILEIFFKHFFNLSDAVFDAADGKGKVLNSLFKLLVLFKVYIL